MRNVSFTLLIAMLVLLTGCGWFDKKNTASTPKLSAPLAPPPSEWFPSLVPPTNFSVDERSQVLKACGAAYASVIWVQYVDLDTDHCNDAIVTISLPADRVPGVANGQKWVTATYVFHGRNEGAFSQAFHPNDMWFSLITDVATSSSTGQSEVRRQFAFRRTAQGIFLTLNDCLYETVAGSLQFRESITNTLNLDTLSPGIPLPLEVEKTSSQTKPAE